jgi:hypothetical protein
MWERRPLGIVFTHRWKLKKKKKKKLWMIAMRLDLLAHYQGAARDELSLRREQW